MSEESFILMDLKDKDSKEIAQSISNNTSRKILDLLSREDNITATKISKKLGIGLSTIHYNLQILIKTKLIESTDFHYSEKGKEVSHYKLSNKIVIIAPHKSKMDSIKEKLRGLIPVGIFAVGTSLALHLIYNNPFNKFFGNTKNFLLNGGEAIEISSKKIVQSPISEATIDFAQNIATNNTVDILSNVTKHSEMIIQGAPKEIILHQLSNNDLIGVWFFLGCLWTMLIYLIFEMYKSKNK